MIYVCLCKETLPDWIFFPNFLNFMMFSTTFRNKNFHAWVRDRTISHIYPAQQYLHTRSHPWDAMRGVWQSTSNNFIKSPPAVCEDCAKRLGYCLGTWVLALHVVRREIRECADNHFSICPVIGSSAPVQGGQPETCGEKTTPPDLAVPDKAQSIFTVSLTLAASAGGMSNTSHHTDFPSLIRLLNPQIHPEILP